MTDGDSWLADIVAGDAEAFGRWLAGAEPTLRASLRGFAAQLDVEEVLQETLLRTWNFAERVEVDGKGDSLLRYAARAARNLAIDKLRKQGRLQLVSLDDRGEVGTVEMAEPDPALRRAIRGCLNELPDRPQQALYARLHNEAAWPDRELASSVEMTLNTFLKNVGRARRLLLLCLKRRGVAQGLVTS